ncbi:MAG: hypothetical protein KDA75_08455, partial [Planctomycetaceae bacterium]|nr:hypothetical protein [Planctomycetaceae bacterium]
MNRLLLTAIVTACLWGAYRGYALWINPLTQPPAAPPTLSVGPIPMPKNPEEFGVANRALRNEGWVKDATFKVRHAEDAYLFFDEYKSSDEKVELKPFAMVWRRSDRRESPYVIQCDSARITFERAFKLGGSESPGRIIAAVLDGKFQITGPSGLVIDGHDCKFSEQEHQLYSDHPIEFQYSPAQGALKLVRGSADKLQIDFTPSTYATHGRDMPRVGDVASLTLRRDVKLLFRHQDGESQTITRVTSAGPFVYDFLRRLATFQEQVHVARPRVNPDGSDGYDDIVAYWLALEFEEQPEDPNAESPSATVTGARSSTVDGLDDDVDEEPPSLGRLQLKYMRAMGQSGADPAIITSTPANFTGKMHDILYDALARRVVMKDEQEGVRLENGEVSLLTPEMQLEHDTQGELTFVSAVREGRLDFERPAADDHPAQKFHALWTRSLTLTPQPELQQTQIVLEGDARVIQPGEMGILCDRLTLDVDSDRLDAGRTEADPTSQKPVDAQPGVVPDALPLRHVLAEGQGGRVAMAGRQFQIETSRLDVTFKSGRLPKGRTGQPAAVTRRVRHSDRDAIELTLCLDSRPLVARRPMSAGSLLSASQQSFWSVPSEGAVPRILAAAPATPGIKSDDHWAIKAHSIEAIVLQDAASQETEIEQVVGEGEVHIRQTPPPRSSLAGPPADDQQPLVV